MPQQRICLYASETLLVEQVVQQSPLRQWSPHYLVASRRLVLPASGATEFCLDGSSVLLDGITALQLPAGLRYRMMPWAGASRTSMVLSASGHLAQRLSAPAAWRLSPRVLWVLRCHWRALARGDDVSATTPAVLARAMTVALPAQTVWPSHSGAVMRAQRFMAARSAQADGDRWSLHDVADVAGCSLFHLSRLFRRDTAQSLHGYRQQLRLAIALQRLEDGERNLAALAHEVGYSSQSHLGQVFQQMLGVTPAQARSRLAD